MRIDRDNRGKADGHQMDVKEGERVWISVSAIVRVTLQDGCYHEDVGHGHCENMKGRAAAIEKVCSALTF